MDKERLNKVWESLGPAIVGLTGVFQIIVTFLYVYYEGLDTVSKGSMVAMFLITGVCSIEVAYRELSYTWKSKR